MTVVQLCHYNCISLALDSVPSNLLKHFLSFFLRGYYATELDNIKDGVTHWQIGETLIGTVGWGWKN